ncbi:MAG: efflux RND transporter periplasmic adaptor subunit [FCB group bacterium]|nr:efflux RND transporter periplasmic adaptor subunit [FCB group bacterium]
MKRTLLLAVGLAVLILPGCKKSSGEPDKKSIPVVEVLKVSTELTRRFQEFSGTLEPVSTIQVFPEAMGKISEIYRNEGATVRAGEPLAKIDQTDYLLALDQAKSALDLASANLKNAQANLERQQQLQQEGFSSEAVLEGIQTAYEIANAQYSQAKTGFSMAQRQLEHTTITAPIDGYINARFIEKGQLALNSAPAYSLQDLDRLKIKLAVSEALIENISARDEVELLFSDDTASGVPGQIVFIGKSPDPSGSYPVKIEVNNENHDLLAGKSAVIRIYSANASNEVVIPGKALLRRGGKWSAFVVEEGIAVEKMIFPANRIHDRMIINSGLKAGDFLVVTGQEYCKSGEEVNIVKTWQSLNAILPAD